MNRREYLKTAGLASAAFLVSPLLKACAGSPPKTILLVSGWQDVNIGDIAHTPGLLHVLQTYLPETKIILWKKSKGEKVEELLSKAFPTVRIIHGDIDNELKVDSKEVIAAYEEADILIHGSGPSIVGLQNLESWRKQTGKSFGLFGVTIGNVTERSKSILNDASFIYTRETASINVLKEAGVTGDHIQFAPDATFFFHLEDEAKASACMQEHGLEKDKFICIIPRLRVTPYYKFRSSANWSEERIREVEELNARCKEWDHAKLRIAMIDWVKNTGNKILICPEMTYQVDIMDELLYDPLPDDIKPNVSKRGYWFPDEAASLYKQAFAVLSFECHSPILAASVGRPFFYLRQPEDTIKGQMYYDLNFTDWVFEIEQTEGVQISDCLMQIWNAPKEAEEKVSKTMVQIAQIYENCCSTVKNVIL